jgi:hypothetical protein
VEDIREGGDFFKTIFLKTNIMNRIAFYAIVYLEVLVVLIQIKFICPKKGACNFLCTFDKKLNLIAVLSIIREL